MSRKRPNRTTGELSANERRRAYYFTDLRPTLCIAVAGAVVLLAVYAIFFRQLSVLPGWVGAAVLTVYLLTVGVLTAVGLYKFNKTGKAARAVSQLAPDVYDMFRYIIDVPYAICDASGNVKVINGAMQDILGHRSALYPVKPEELFGNIQFRTITERVRNPEGHITSGMSAYPRKQDNGEIITRELSDGRMYELTPYIMDVKDTPYYFILFTDIFNYTEAKRVYAEEMPAVGYIELDNLQELTQFVRANYHEVASRTEILLIDWAHKHNALIREYDRDKYMFVMSAKQLHVCIDEKFDILETVMKQNVGDNSMPVTVSMGIALIEGTMEARETAADDALKVAIQRGGSQVALRLGAGSPLEFFGGSHKALDTNTTVSSRVACDLLTGKLENAGNILIMGHSNPDFDSIGSCIGAYRLAKSAIDWQNSMIEEENQKGVLLDPEYKQKPLHTPSIRIIIDTGCQNFFTCRGLLKNLPEYNDVFVSREDALDCVLPTSVLIVTDVNNPRIFECPELASKVKDIAIIDHHILAGELPFRPFLHYIETAKSSASEIITEMLQQSPWQNVLKKEEANALLAGIMLDTNNFTRNAGAQTFEITHYLYLSGAHTGTTAALFEENMNSLRIINEFESHMRTYRGNIAITWLSSDRTPNPNDRVAAARAADKLLGVKGIDAAFALVRSSNSTVLISGRSKKDISVQLILEKLEGGGHFDVAGAQLKDTSLSEACLRLRDAIDSYLDESKSIGKK